MNEYRDKLRSIGAPRRAGTTRTRVERAEGATVVTTEHWSGQQDATVRPDTIRYSGRVHNTGKRKGETAEVIPMTRKTAKDRYGPNG